MFPTTHISVLSWLQAQHLVLTAQNCQPLLPVMDPRCCWWERVEGEKRKHKQQISGILQRIRSWELELALFKWWNGSPKGPRLRSTLLVTKRSSPSERREGMINTLGSTQLLNFCVLFPPLLNSKLSCSWGLFRFEHELLSLCGNSNVTDTLRATRAREQRGRRQTSELFLFVEIQKWSCYPGGSSCFPYSSATWQASTGAVSHWAPSRPSLPQAPLSPLHLPHPSPFLPLSSHHPPLTPSRKTLVARNGDSLTAQAARQMHWR